MKCSEVTAGVVDDGKPRREAGEARNMSGHVMSHPHPHPHTSAKIREIISDANLEPYDVMHPRSINSRLLYLRSQDGNGPIYPRDESLEKGIEDATGEAIN